MKHLVKRVFGVSAAVAVGVAAVYLLRPQPLVVDVGDVTQGPMQVTIDEDGQTRAHDRFVLAAPVSGFLSRITLHEGDRVRAGITIATVRPLPLDVRTETGMRAQVSAAEAAEHEAAQWIARAQTAHEQAKRDLRRAESLLKTEDISRQRFEEAESKEAIAARDVEAAKARAASAAAETARARAGLISEPSPNDGPARPLAIRAPFDAHILQILEKSERVVTAGTPIVMLSNPGRLEIVADLLSTDAVQVTPGATVSVENWGGPKPLRARVRTVEPYGFTKVSALGVEEQRVNVISDFVESPENLGDGYRVDVRIVIWQNNQAIRVPASALFRVGTAWNVFIAENGVAKQKLVTIGHRNATEAEVLAGLVPAQKVIIHPAGDLHDGARIAPRNRSGRP